MGGREANSENPRSPIPDDWLNVPMAISIVPLPILSALSGSVYDSRASAMLAFLPPLREVELNGLVSEQG